MYGSVARSIAIGIGIVLRIVDRERLAALEDETVLDARRGHDDRLGELALETLLEYLEVEEPEEPAPESLPERLRGVLLVNEGGVVELVALEGVGERIEILRFHRIHGREDDRLDLAETGERRRDGIVLERDRIADPRVAHRLDAGDDVADLPRVELLSLFAVDAEHADLLDAVRRPEGHEAYRVAGPQRAVEDAAADDRAAERIVFRVEHERRERLRRVSRRRRNVARDRLEYLLHAGARLSRGENRLVRVEPELGLDLFLRVLDVGGGGIDLVDDRDDREVVLERRVEVRERLGLHSLRRVDEEQHPFAGGERARDLVGEIDVARRIDQVQDELLARLVRVREAHGLALDRDAALPLDVHRVEHLVVEIAVLDELGALDEAVGERRFAVVDMRDDAEITYLFHSSPRPCAIPRVRDSNHEM